MEDEEDGEGNGEVVEDEREEDEEVEEDEVEEEEDDLCDGVRLEFPRRPRRPRSVI